VYISPGPLIETRASSARPTASNSCRSALLKPGSDPKGELSQIARLNAMEKAGFFPAFLGFFVTRKLL
jgi:hypothetical protein